MWKQILVLGLSVSVLTACGSAQETEGSEKAETIKIGASFDLTGPYAQYGSFASNGAQMAIEEAGIVDEKVLEYIVEDNKGTQIEAANTFKKLVDSKKIDVFIGADVSSNTETIANLAQEREIPMVTPTATKESITSIGDHIFRACYIDPTQGELLAQFSTGDLGATTAVVMVNSENAYSTGIAEAFITEFEAKGGKIVKQINYGAADVDFRPILGTIQGVDADVIVIPDYYETIGMIAPQIRELGIKSTLIGGDGWDGVTEQTKNNPEAVEGSYFVNHYTVQDDSELVQDFIANYTEKYGETPNAFAALGYDAARILIEAIDTADSTDNVAVTNALVTGSFEGVTGKITFDENRNPVKTVSVIQITNGENTLYKKLDPSQY
ncbi:hypothetical protein AN639_01070 [Candidatus Epulonipiscium fishelsonii]|uniref:Uncharacterized protein n=1 Tax=Candidatus Epulonipiscium fishelsonii TaxID=77094 RepID=A0ACC8X7P2_9FIRM|nr:hypothetical protein AN396_12175 [Epulopiscium sp. SCG-B11WGA-EpuloA1]ONI40700.1 hypothetical protein AN639_01070 [Epulopiscium sp. SCG-B05WGA-EpuloA1]